jgi:hypothetical protein
MDNKRLDSSDVYDISSERYEFRGVDKAMKRKLEAVKSISVTRYINPRQLASKSEEVTFNCPESETL